MSLANPLLSDERAHRRQAKLWRKKLTMQQHYALHRYAGSSYAPLNAGLRGSDDPRYVQFGDLDERGVNLHEVLASIKPLTIPAPATVWRGSVVPEQLMQNGRWTDPAWVSCSVDEDYARFAASSSPENQRGSLLTIELDAGCQYIPISYAIDDPQAGEILLVPGHRFRVSCDKQATVQCWGPWDLMSA